MAKHQSQHVVQLRTKRESHSNLMRALRDCVRRNAVYTDRRKHQRHEPKHAQHSRRNLRRKQREPHVLSQRLHVKQREGGIERLHLFAHCTKQLLGISLRTHDQHASRVVVLTHRRPDKRPWIFRDVEILTCLCHTDDANPWTTRALETEALADCFSSVLQFRYQPPHKRLIHNRNRFRFLLILFGKLAALHNRGPHRLEVIWSNGGSHRRSHVLAAVGRLTFHEYVVAVVVETEWYITANRG